MLKWLVNLKNPLKIRKSHYLRFVGRSVMYFLINQPNNVYMFLFFVKMKYSFEYLIVLAFTTQLLLK